MNPKTLHMRIEHMFYKLDHVQREWQAMAERLNGKNSIGRLRTFYATELKREILKLRQEIDKMNYIEVE